MNLPRSAFARRAAIVILAAFAAALPQAVVAQSDPLAGNGISFRKRSTFTPGPARYKNMTMTFSGSGEMTLEGVDAQGRPVKATYSAPPMGKTSPRLRHGRVSIPSRGAASAIPSPPIPT